MLLRRDNVFDALFRMSEMSRQGAIEEPDAAPIDAAHERVDAAGQGPKQRQLELVIELLPRLMPLVSIATLTSALGERIAPGARAHAADHPRRDFPTGGARAREIRRAAKRPSISTWVCGCSHPGTLY